MKTEGWSLCSIGAGRSRRAGGGFGVGSPEEGGGEGQGGRVLGEVVPEEGGTAAQRRQSGLGCPWRERAQAFGWLVGTNSPAKIKR